MDINILQETYSLPKFVAIQAKDITRVFFLHSGWRNMSIIPSSFVFLILFIATFVEQLSTLRLTLVSSSGMITK